MKVLLNLALEDRHVAQIQAVTEQVEVVRPTASKAALEAVEEAVVDLGDFTGSCSSGPGVCAGSSLQQPE